MFEKNKESIKKNDSDAYNRPNCNLINLVYCIFIIFLIQLAQKEFSTTLNYSIFQQ